uniref:ATP-dependent DNA helicase n=1 Tax=Amphimedon queenslandica TaxID=400682 RepID=A0A1X7U285_AMPQE
MLHTYQSNLIILMYLVTLQGLHLDLCYVRVCICIKNSFPFFSYAITIHKCQGLSLDTAIIDLLYR